MCVCVCVCVCLYYTPVAAIASGLDCVFLHRNLIQLCPQGRKGRMVKGLATTSHTFTLTPSHTHNHHHQLTSSPSPLTLTLTSTLTLTPLTHPHPHLSHTLTLTPHTPSHLLERVLPFSLVQVGQPAPGGAEVVPEKTGERQRSADIHAHLALVHSHNTNM